MNSVGRSGRARTDGEALAAEGDGLAAEGLLEEALYKYDEALRADESLYRANPSHPHIAMRYCSIGALYRADGDDDSALEYFAKAARVEEASEGSVRRTALASYLSNLGGVFRSKGDVDGANDAYCRALDHLRKAMPPLDEVERVVAAEESEAFEREADAFDRDAVGAGTGHANLTTSVDDMESMLGPSGFLNTAASVLNNLGLLYKSLGEPASARRCYLRAISFAVIAVGEFDPANAARHRNLGAALLDMGHAKLALERFERAAGMCALGYGHDHPETARADEWVAFAKALPKDAGDSGARSAANAAALSSSPIPKKRPPLVLPSVVEWFLEELRCGVLEPTPDPGLPEEEEALRREEKENAAALKRKFVAATPEGDDGTVTPIPMPESVGVGGARGVVGTGDTPSATETTETPGEGEARSSERVSIAAVAIAKGAARRARLFAPLEPERGEDMLAPYARPRVKVVGGDDSSPMWKAVSAERSAVASGAGAMPAGRDYIAAYLEQAPGYANLITPFAEMPTELLMPYSAYKGYGVPRPAEPGSLPRLAHRPRAMETLGSPGIRGGRAAE